MHPMVPEPSTLVLGFCGLAGVALIPWRRRTLLAARAREERY
jgi:hypothetical protein